jgi:GxxExxY protein
MVPTFRPATVRLSYGNKPAKRQPHAVDLGAFFEVYNYFGYGLAEPVYAGGLELELLDRGHEVVRELAVSVCYKARHVAWQRLDMVVDNRIILEIKATELLPPYAKRQIVNYLQVTPFRIGLLLHFGPEAKFHRFIDSQKRAFGAQPPKELPAAQVDGLPNRGIIP